MARVSVQQSIELSTEDSMLPPRADLSAPAESAKRSPNDKDLELVAKSLEGDSVAFGDLVTRYNARIFAVAFRILGDRAEAEDLTQDVFITLHKNLGQFRGDSKLSTWIYRVTKNRCLNRLKFLQRRHVGRHRDIADPVVESAISTRHASVDPTDKISNEELRAVLEEHLLMLPEEQRVLVVLRDLEDQSYEEISTITELPLGTVKSRLHRARLALAKSVGPLLRHGEAS